MQELREFLKGRAKGEFARSVGIAPAYLSQILSGDRRPSFQLMVRIEQATNGGVPLAAWVQRAAE